MGKGSGIALREMKTDPKRNRKGEELMIQKISNLQKWALLLVALTCFSSVSLLYVYSGFANTFLKPNDVTLPQKAAAKPKNNFSVDDYIEMSFDESEEGKLAAFGKKLVTETYAWMGPDTKASITGNRLACTSCHLQGGTKSFAAPFVGVAAVFPIYIGRENRVESLEERINGCFERSMNGRAIDINSREMRAIVTYIKFLSKGVPIGSRIQGQGFVKINVPPRAADTKQGEKLYVNICASCHGLDGQGKRGNSDNRNGGYIYPPLWGSDSYNDGAGMARLLTAAKFIKANMPYGVTYDNPTLTDEQAYDIAAFINSHQRPMKANKELDYPDLSKKPVDCPYPPYNDAITEQQHKFGPYDFARKNINIKTK